MRPGRRITVDVGDARIGVATCDPGGLLATPVETVPAGTGARARIAEIAAEYAAIEVVVGLPRSLNGREGPAAVKARAFAVKLAKLVAPVPVRLVDERMTTVTASRELRAAGRRAAAGRPVIDQAAAVVILQSALDTERGSAHPPGETVPVP